ncbi:transposase [Mesorhizobium sp. LCM 4577]|uniref:transposase n=1 Tax=Mesorhizobium sp. LCM 4577 TaxID=1848288 RepID=UPI00352B2A93
MAASCFWPGPSEGLQLADRLATAIQDSRNPQRVTHAMAEILRARIFATASGYEMPTISIGCAPTRPSSSPVDGRPTEGIDLCSQPTCSRIENLPDLLTVIRLGWVLVDFWLSSYAAPPKSVTLDIADTLDVVHGHQQLSLFNAALRPALLPADPHL